MELHRFSNQISGGLRDVLKRFEAFLEVSEVFPRILGGFTGFQLSFRAVSGGLPMVLRELHMLLNDLHGCFREFQKSFIMLQDVPVDFKECRSF